MRLEKKILLYWSLAFIVLRIALEFPHRDFGWIGFISTLIQVLMGLICFQVFRLSRGSQKMVWMNLTLLFGLAPITLLATYVGTSIFPGDAIAAFYTHLYINEIWLPFLTVLTVIYIAVDYYFRLAGPVRKYIFSAVVAIVAAAPFLGREAVNPLSIFQEPEWQEYRTVRWYADSLTRAQEDVTPEAITALITQAGWGNRTPDQIRETVHQRYPLLKDQNYTVIFWKPVDIAAAGVRGVGVGIIILLLVSIYRSNRPVHAYMDKILLGLGGCGILEIIHGIQYTRSASLAGYVDFFMAAQYFIILFFMLLVGIFSLKLRFLALGAGRYYETALAHRPGETTRFIDDIDKLVLTAFFPGRKQAGMARQQPSEHPES